MRFKKAYTLVSRRNAKGKKVWYYRVWNPETGKQREFSTGCRTRDAAEKFCTELQAKNGLLPSRNLNATTKEAGVPTVPASVPTFEKFASPWWGPNCPYLASELARNRSKSRTYVELNKIRLRKQLLPAFGRYPIDAITPGMVDEWLLGMSGGPRVRNTALATLKLMLGRAAELGEIPSNPAQRISPVHQEKKARKLLTNQEYDDVFDSSAAWEVWTAAPIEHLACLLAYRTGMRAGEVLGLQAQSLVVRGETTWVIVQHSWDRKQLKGTKSGKIREVPLPPKLAEELHAIAPTTGFVFSEDKGLSPISYYSFRNCLIRAMKATGIREAEQKRRGLGLHAFRYSLNTKLRGHLSDDKIRAIIGHSSEAMTDHYTSHTVDDLSDVGPALDSVFSRVDPPGVRRE